MIELWINYAADYSIEEHLLISFGSFDSEVWLS